MDGTGGGDAPAQAAPDPGPGAQPDHDRAARGQCPARGGAAGSHCRWERLEQQPESGLGEEFHTSARAANPAGEPPDLAAGRSFFVRPGDQPAGCGRRGAKTLRKLVDRAKSYTGLRSIAIDGQKILLNGKPLFQRLVLDQGYYPDGILTAPSEQALIQDIELSQAAGFNGARLHQKVFEERFLYHADRLGYLVWGEFPDWGCSGFGAMPEHQQPGATYITQWLEAIERDYSHPSIVGWCPLNETWQVITDRLTVLDDVTRGMFLATKAMDGTRPVLDASGYSHRVAEADVYDCHTYEQDVARFAQEVDPIRQGKPFTNRSEAEPGTLRQKEFSLAYRGQPYFVSEFGGIWWNPDVRPGEFSWGYGNRPTSNRGVLPALRRFV